MFWTIFKADALFSLCSIGIATLATIAIAWWRKRKKKGPATQQLDGPRVFVVGGTNPKPGHCPLCGLDWPLPGPFIPDPPAAPGAHASDER
jgi:hypothetical protein